MQPLYNRLHPFKIFGTTAAYELGMQAATAIWELFQRDGLDFERYEAAEARLLEQIRIDLDIDDGRVGSLRPRSRWASISSALTRSGRA